MAKNIVRLDIVEGKPRTFVADKALENGFFLEIKGKAQNAVFGAVDYEAYAVELANASTAREDLLFHASVENMYDERLLKADFELEAGMPGRGYQLVLGDIVTIPKKLISGEVVVGAELCLTADGKLVVGSGAGKIAVVEALEDIVVPLYGFGADEVQESVVIRIA